MKKETLFVSFSGGRTSGYMCQWLIQNKSDEYDLIFVFSNTGLEHERTLDFLDKCDKHMGLNLVWVEAVVHPDRGVGCTHKVVDYASAARHGEPFEKVIQKYGIPNQDYPHCTRETKMSPMFSYKRSLGFKSNHLMAIGIRADEPNRLSPTAKENGLIYPLAEWTQCTEAEVRHWWKDQPFDLDLPTHYGNCVTCWKKSDRKLMTIAKHEPERFYFMDSMERTYGDAGAGDQKRVFFRKYRTAQDILKAAKEPFKEFVDTMPEYQLGLFPTEDKIAVLISMDDIDVEEDCRIGVRDNMKNSTTFKIGVIIMAIYFIVLFHFLITVVKVARDHHLSSVELTEIPINSNRLPKPGTYEYEIQFCPDGFGRVQEYLDCRAEILARL